MRVRPIRQALQLRIDPRGTTYTGTVRIQLDILAPLNSIWLHAQELKITGATVAQGGPPRRASTVWPDYDSVADGPVRRHGDRLGVFTDAPLKPGPAELMIDFEGTLDKERSRAIYRVDEPDGGAYVFTFFEPVDARRAFPCFDEPSFKIPWELGTLTAPEGGAFAIR
jgi:aminopeptidase N